MEKVCEKCEVCQDMLEILRTCSEYERQEQRYKDAVDILYLEKCHEVNRLQDEIKELRKEQEKNAN
ncbi:MAG: hypothetical protein E7265_06735 [Lachnospiraceae bacterium]|nr:hypothetical protein [Lachnospiraceae bacterium]